MGAEKSKKGSHLTKEERRIIAVLHEEGRSPYEIGKLTGRASNTIRNELKRGTTTIILGYYEKEKSCTDSGDIDAAFVSYCLRKRLDCAG